MHSLTPYGYATVALAAREPEYEPEEPDGLLDDDDYEAPEDREPAYVEDESVPYTSCPDWPHSYPCGYCGGNGCRHCGRTGERQDWRRCRH